MTDVTRILSQIESGDPSAAGQLLPLVYDELRKLAAAKLAHEKQGQTLQPTALVHEAYLRLANGGQDQPWNSRGHFFGAASEAMRRILVENARRKAAEKHGGARQRVDLDEPLVAAEERPEELLAVDEALSEFEQHHPQAAQLVKLGFFGGLGHSEACEALGISRRAGDRLWILAKAWLYKRLH
jgi:RNA polymerase sigma factor (TIGR02999 family)